MCSLGRFRFQYPTLSMYMVTQEYEYEAKCYGSVKLITAM